MSESTAPKIRPRSPRKEGGLGAGCAITFAFPFVGMGLYIILVALGVIDGGEVKAPTAVVALVGLLFIIAGLTVALNGLKESKRRAHLKEQAANRADEPWFADHHWDPEGIEAEGRGAILSLFMAVVLIGALSVPMNWLAWFKEGSPGLAKFFAIFGLLMFVGFSIWLVISILRRKKYGLPKIRYNSFPFFMDEELDITLLPVPNLDTFDSLKIILECLEEDIDARHTIRNGKSEIKKIHYCRGVCETEQVIEGPGKFNSTGDGLRIPMPIPEEGRSTHLKDLPKSYWYLHIIADTPGVDFKAKFLVPVYRR